MINADNIQRIVGKKLNMDVHPSLLGDLDIIYALNADVSGNESDGNSWFVQNQLSNRLCYEFPEDYIFLGSIKLNRFDHVVFFKTSDSSEIGILNTLECIYTPYVNAPCLNFTEGNKIRGVFKHNGADNKRRIYFIDGVNPNRFIDIDEDYPKVYSGSKCDSCELEEGTDLDCDQIKIVRDFRIPCVTLNYNNEGNLPSGVYQVGIAYAEDDFTLTDYYFSAPFKIFSERKNIALNLEVDCEDSPFSQYSIILITNTRESSLTTYNIGTFPLSHLKNTITNLNVDTIVDTGKAVSKRVIYDQSQHIVTNGETLLLGKHNTEDILKYQPLANEIEVEWLEVKVPKDKAHLYPNFMRDERYGIGIQWYGTRGNNRGQFHIPGRAPTDYDLEEVTGQNVIVQDCDYKNLRWQVYNTAELIEEDPSANCSECFSYDFENSISKRGTMGYWESQDFYYPNDADTWGDLACQPIRHHRMPSHNLTHFHNDFTTIELPPSEDDCYDIETTGGTIEYCPSGMNQVVEDDCINILTIRLKNIQHPLNKDLEYDSDISGYRVLVSDRTGNKSILHKGLLYNVRKDTSTAGTDIYYPNYPYNDLTPDYYLSTSGVFDLGGEPQPPVTGLPVKDFQYSKYTYHSPDIHYREMKDEFGTELRLYGNETGWIEGQFNNVYLHPKTRLGLGGIQDKPYTNNACQIDSVAHYSKFDSLIFSRFRYSIEDSQYLLPVNQILSNGQKFNNFLRESSYYINLGDESDTNNWILEGITTEPRDISRPTLGDFLLHKSQQLFGNPSAYNTNKCPIPFNYFDNGFRWNYLYPDNDQLDHRIQATSVFVSICNTNPNQYRSLEQIIYRPIGCITNVDFNIEDESIIYESPVIFGGDTYVSKHSILRKMPLYTEWLTDVPIETETDYFQFRNIWYPTYGYDNLTVVDDLFTLDNEVRTYYGDDYTSEGKFYLFVTGVIEFWCESEFIGNYREQDSTINGQFYPKIDFNDIARSDKIPYDNKFLYNFILLNNEVERFYQNLDPTVSDNDFIVAYSEKDDVQSQGDKWLQFLPLNYTILPRIYGTFTGMHVTDMYSIMFLFENQILYSQLNFSLTMNEGNRLLLNQGDIFNNRLIKLSNEQTGYVGCVDPLCLTNTRYGTFFFDRYRKRFFRWDGQLHDITGNMGSWFQNYLSDEAPDYENSIITVFDNFTENLYITGGDVRNKWTLSYKPKMDGFISFHSFLPDYYMTSENNYLSVNNVGIWMHNDKYNYQTYYGEPSPFEVGLILNNKFRNVELQSINLLAEFIKYNGYGESIYKKDKFFDKVLAYNNNGSTGLMDVLLKDKTNPNQSLVQNLDTNSPLITEVTHVGDSVYRFNKFESIRTDHHNQPLLIWDGSGMFYTPQSLDTTIPPHQREDIKGKWIKLHLKSETNTDHKILVQLMIPETDDIKR